MILQAALAFNLICTGTAVMQHSHGGSESREDLQEIRVDLQSRRFCLDTCERTVPIASISDGEIVFQDETSETGLMRIYRRVFRERGAFYAYIKLDAAILTTEGRCDPAPFTGFPERE